jgi:hypothetical protein
MKKIIFIIATCLMLLSCNNYKDSEVIIKSKMDTVNIDSTYCAELYVPYNDSILPSFFITTKTDTARIPIDELKRCAIYRAVSPIQGLQTISGFVNYINTKGERIKKDYIIKFYVRHL